MKLSIVILCYRSEEQVIPFAQKAKEIGLSLTENLEIILVGNYVVGANDRTKEVVERIADQDPIFKSICLPKKGMMGWDMRKGLEKCTGDMLCVIDGDGQFPLNSIKQAWNLMKDGKYELIKSYRSHRSDGWSRVLLSRVYNLTFALLYPSIGSKDVNSKPKMFSKDLYERMNLKSDDWFIDAEIMIRSGEMGIRFHEFPIEFDALEGRTSFVKIGAIIEFVRNLVIHKFLRK